MEVLTVAIQKGGTGKTTTAAILAQAAAKKGLAVLAIDLDPQANLTLALAATPQTDFTSYELINGEHGQPQRTQDGIDVIPASWNLAAIKSSPGSARRLQEAIKPLKEDYDLIIIDTPPTAGELQFNALQAATGLLIPLYADIYDIQALYQITSTAEQIQKTNTALKIKGFVITKYDSRSTIARQMQENIIISANKKNIPYLGSIRNGIAVQEAAALQQSIYNYAPKSKPALDYMALLEQII